MASEHPIAKIGDVADSISETHKFGKEQLIFLNTSDILHGEILHRTYSDVRNWPGQAKKSIRKDDILFSEIRPANGRWAYVVGDACDFVVSTKLMVIRARQERLYPPFLYQFLTSSQTTKWLQHLAESRSGTFPQITFEQVASLELPLPPLGEQRRIARILGSFDDKIELNRRTNETLESMARALFKSWFIDFDPVRANAAGHKPAGPDSETAALFPARFVGSLHGTVPAGWRTVALPEAIEVNPERRLSRGVVAPYLEMSNMPTTSARAVAWVDREFGSGMRFANGDVLLARITPCLENGKTAFVDFLADNQVGWGSTEYIVLRSKPPLPPAFTYFLARTEEFRDHVIQNMTGTSGRQRAPAECLNKYRVVVPTERIARRFGDLIAPKLAAMKVNDEQSASLAAGRDALLPKLLSGQFHAATVADSESTQ